jgi:hypothetical protein
VLRHQGQLVVRRGRLLATPQLVKGAEVPILGRGVEDEQPRRRLGDVAEAVCRAPRYQDEVLRLEAQCTPVDLDRDLAGEHEVRLGAVGVPVQRRSPAAGREGALHQREVVVVGLAERLEQHPAAARGVEPALAATNDPLLLHARDSTTRLCSVPFGAHRRDQWPWQGSSCTPTLEAAERGGGQ